MFYEKNVIRITYANKTLHLFSENQLFGETYGKIAVQLTDKLFSHFGEKGEWGNWELGMGKWEWGE
ncbi:hypothetical protein [Nostoc sp. 'Peltigera malacea cyanobiont' DB3992]|uniref:hypothetical protein n=1 Tax=Nostoc sp. 'Peltigera malacea cyanobiont' DB3992 TaxID=1206980 RepID=UPI000C03D280|nr:hypothetical protein [Nostoc sp. 'Peltigera malacea cyanobiont' DB3992]PHM06973.1 hypothetical protein CK516_29985 [Nostoc sp. 'Peltigera malacea cyanobiont' DB3992]